LIFGGVLPTPFAFDGEEVDREATQHAPFLEQLRHPSSNVLDVPIVLGVGGESAPEEDLTRRPAHYLVVRRDDGDLTEGIYAALHRRGSHLLPAFQKTLDDSAHFRELMAVALPGLATRLEAYPPRQFGPNPAREILTLRSIHTREDRVAFAREALVQLDHHAPHLRAATLQFDYGFYHVPFVA
jgi:hypothetical protein